MLRRAETYSADCQCPTAAYLHRLSDMPSGWGVEEADGDLGKKVRPIAEMIESIHRSEGLFSFVVANRAERPTAQQKPSRRTVRQAVAAGVDVRMRKVQRLLPPAGRRDGSHPPQRLNVLVGVRGFEPPAPASRTQCSTRLSYTPAKAAHIAPSARPDKALLQALGLNLGGTGHVGEPSQHSWNAIQHLEQITRGWARETTGDRRRDDGDE